MRISKTVRRRMQILTGDVKKAGQKNISTMKKPKKYFLSIFIGLLVLLPLACLASCFFSIFIPEDPIKLAGSMLDVDIPEGTTVLTNNDTGPGLPFPGGASDGYTFIILQLPPDKIAGFSDSLAKSSVWKPLPLSPEFSGHEDAFQPSYDIEETIPITTSTGYYYFMDRQAEYNKKKGEQVYDTTKPFYERDSENFTFGLFNDKDGKLYLWRNDT